MPSDEPALIAVDWGTSAFRAYLAAEDGRIVDQVQSAKGILAVEGDRFAETLGESVAKWVTERRLPVIMSGMIGSRQGWHEVPYVACPAKPLDLVGGLTSLVVEGGAADGLRVAIVPGVMTRDHSGMPDVLRGEETQIAGCMKLLGLSGGTFVLPGTHSKWATVSEGAIISFATYMTGEVFGALKQHTILGRLMTSSASAGEAVTAGFDRGLNASRRLVDGSGPGALLRIIFSARTLGLFSEIEHDQISDYLSGLVIGAEVAEASDRDRDVWIVGSDALCQRYELACSYFGLTSKRAPPNCAAAGLIAVGRSAGMFGRSE